MSKHKHLFEFMLRFSCLWNLHMNVNKVVNPVGRSWVCASLFRRKLCYFSHFVWTHFSLLTMQPLPLASLLVDDMLLCFGNIFASQVIFQASHSDRLGRFGHALVCFKISKGTFYLFEQDSGIFGSLQIQNKKFW